MPRQIIIHAGQHKTGTTSIQHYIAHHVGFFLRNGIAPIRDWRSDLTGEADRPVRFNASAIANGTIRAGLMTPVRLNGGPHFFTNAQWEAAAERINAHMRSFSHERLLLSAEAFSFLREPEEKRRLERLCAGMDIKPLLFLREPGAWLESWRNQVFFTKLEQQPGAIPGCGNLDLTPSSWLLDHNAIRAFWGREATILSYEDAMAEHGSVIPAFLEALGLDLATCPSWKGLLHNSTAEKRARWEAGGTHTSLAGSAVTAQGKLR